MTDLGTAPRSGALNRQLLRLAEVLQISARAREVPRAELAFVIVNETNRVVPYRQAALWDARSASVVMLSGAARVEPAAPLVLFLNRLCNKIAKTPRGDEPFMFDRAAAGELAGEWDSWLTPQVLWWPLRVHADTVAALLLDREEPWTDTDEVVLEAVCGAYAQAWELSRARRIAMNPARTRRLRAIAIGLAAAAFVGAMFFPVQSSAIAPAEIVARSPAFVRAPFSGVVDAITVAPNAPVRTRQILVRLERRQLDAELQVAKQAVEIATAQIRQTTQEAIADPKVREQLALLRAKLDEAKADFEYRRGLLERADIPSPLDGVAVFNEPAEWIGRPVEMGQRIMQVAPPTSTRIEIDLPVSDQVTFEDGAEVLFFDNLAPDRPVPGTLVFTSYTTSLSLAGVLVYTCRADLVTDEPLRLGLKGNAKIVGPRRPLVLWLLRRPIAYVRAILA